MKTILVDTSVWVDHFRNTNQRLVDLLELELVATHPLIIGEIACGTPPKRTQTLADLSKLQQCVQASLKETLFFVEREQLFGLGCGLIDFILLASTKLTDGMHLWTFDKRFQKLLERFDVSYLHSK